MQNSFCIIKSFAPTEGREVKEVDI